MLPDSKPSRKIVADTDTVNDRDELQFPVPFGLRPRTRQLWLPLARVTIDEAEQELPPQWSAAFSQISKTVPTLSSTWSRYQVARTGLSRFHVKVGVAVLIVFFGDTVEGAPGTGTEVMTL